MQISSNHFKFSQPSGWSCVSDKGRHIFHSPNREELIVSGASIQGTGETSESEEMVAKLFQNAEMAARKAASHPALVVQKEFCRDERLKNADIWTLLCETVEGDVLFYQAVVRNSRGVLIVTFEAANKEVARDQFDKFLRSIEG